MNSEMKMVSIAPRTNSSKRFSRSDIISTSNISDMTIQLDMYAADSFTPGLDKLDAIFASLKIEK